ncbi:MAG: ABC transporter substrate-binding protein [Oscillospiraceae bacterium]|nr:ABC transporter substrate-binding protein [Oscillospiraceae bacterium]
MKKIIALLMALVMLLSLAACGSSGSDDESSSGAVDASTNADADAEGEETEAVSGDTAILKIGGLVNQTGWFATYDYNNALEMQCLADYYNNQGGITIGDTTYTIEVVVQDGQSDTSGIRSAAQLLADDEDIHYVIETNDFWVAGALDIFENAGIMNVMSQNNLDFTAMGTDWQYAYSFFNAAPAQFAAALTFVQEMYPDATRIVYCCDDNGSNNEQAALVKAVCEELGLEYVDSPIVYDAEATDFSAIALQLMNSGADVFIGNGDVNNTGSILKELRNSGSDMVCACVVGSSASMLLDACGLSDVSRAFTMGIDPEDTENNTEIFNEVYSLFKEKYGEDTAASWCGASVNNMYVLLQLMQGAGSVEVEDVCAYYDTLTEVETLYGTGTIGGTETFGINHIVAHPNSITYLENGEVISYGAVECSVP